MSASAFAQQFEVATVRPHDRAAECTGSDLLPGGRFVATCWPLKQLIQEAYNVLPHQIEGGPGWISSELWDINARAEGVGGEIPLEQLRPMLARFIEGRFHLTLRAQERTLPVFVLASTKAKPPGKLIPNTGAPFQFDVNPDASGATLICRKVTMAQLASWLKDFLAADRPVIDKTGLNGAYDFTIHWNREAPPPPGPADLPPAPNAGGQILIDAIRSQLGLRLTPQKSGVTVFVVDRAERPDVN